MHRAAYHFKHSVSNIVSLIVSWRVRQ